MPDYADLLAAHAARMASRPAPDPLTDAEKTLLETCPDANAWAAALRGIKAARHKRLPPDWIEFALDSGLMERVTGYSVADLHRGAPSFGEPTK